MHIYVKHISSIGMVIFGISIATAHAQFQPRPGYPPWAFNNSAAGLNPYGSSINSLQAGSYGVPSSPYTGAGYGAFPGAGYYPNYGSNSYYPSYDSYTGSLYGSAILTNSFGQFTLSTQQAARMREQVRTEQLRNRRELLDQWLSEQGKVPPLQEASEDSQRLQLRRSQHEPPTREIFSGRALNDLLTDAQKHQTAGRKGPPIPLDALDLSQINFQPHGTVPANVGFLKALQNDNRLQWPIGLRGEEYGKEREALRAALRLAIQEALSNRTVDAESIQEMTRLLHAMSAKLRADLNQKPLPPSVYSPARNFLTDLGQSIHLLGAPNASSYFDGKLTATGRNVADLIDDMQKKGLVFAAALPSQQPSYLALHRLLAAYDLSLNSSPALAADKR